MLYILIRTRNVNSQKQKDECGGDTEAGHPESVYYQMYNIDTPLFRTDPVRLWSSRLFLGPITRPPQGNSPLAIGSSRPRGAHFHLLYH
jgi:hypothetical protein